VRERASQAKTGGKLTLDFRNEIIHDPKLDRTARGEGKVAANRNFLRPLLYWVVIGPMGKGGDSSKKNLEKEERLVSLDAKIFLMDAPRRIKWVHLRIGTKPVQRRPVGEDYESHGRGVVMFKGKNSAGKKGNFGVRQYAWERFMREFFPT